MDVSDYRRVHFWGNHEIPTTVYRLTHPERPTLYEKVAPSLRSEYERLVWCQGRLPVPEIVAFESIGDGDHLWTMAMEGVPAHDRVALPDQPGAARALAEAWKSVHQLDPTECPFDSSTSYLLHEVGVRVTTGESVRIWDVGQQRERHAADVFQELLSTQPAPTEPVVIHGDACVPNVLVRDGRLAGIVDLGMLGVGDRWWDLAACIGSMSRPDNVLGAEVGTFLDAYGCERDALRERWFQLLYRLVFDLPAGPARS